MSVACNQQLSRVTLNFAFDKFIELPNFKYHPEPVNTWAILNKYITSICCKKKRGFYYAGAVYAVADIEPDTIRPWCISDGSAHKVLSADFVENFISEDGKTYGGFMPGVAP